MTFWQQLVDHLNTGEPAFVAQVAFNTTHSPGTRGAKMFVEPDGTITGTIGGGGMEADVIEKGLEALGSEEYTPGCETLVHRKEGQGKKSGLICAGKQTHLYWVARPDRDLAILEEVVERLEHDKPGLMTIDEVGLALGREESIERETPPVRLVEDDEAAGGWQYEEQIINWKRAAVVGGGHVGAAVCRQLAMLGYSVENFDTRADIFEWRDEEWAAHRHVVDDYVEAGDLVRFPQLTHAIVVTSDQPSDVRGLQGLAGKPFPYIGAMGSPAKLHKIREDLLAEGVDESFFDAWHAPIGLEMTSNKPPEIAVSIASELLRLREELFPHADAPTPGELDEDPPF
ncbi:MAG: XdhC family protein [Bradymonadaceae bacterium]